MELELHAVSYHKYMKKILIPLLFLVFIFGYLLGINSNSKNLSAITESKTKTNSILEKEVEYMKNKGFNSNNSNLSPNQPFTVLIGTCSGSADGYCRKAFFFYNGKFVGNDSDSPSIDVSLKWLSGNIIALEYTLYKNEDPLSSPTGGSAIVRFQYEGNTVKALDPIPSVDINAKLHR